MHMCTYAVHKKQSGSSFRCNCILSPYISAFFNKKYICTQAENWLPSWIDQIIYNLFIAAQKKNILPIEHAFVLSYFIWGARFLVRTFLALFCRQGHPLSFSWEVTWTPLDQSEPVCFKGLTADWLPLCLGVWREGGNSAAYEREGESGRREGAMS